MIWAHTYRFGILSFSLNDDSHWRWNRCRCRHRCCHRCRHRHQSAVMWWWCLLFHLLGKYLHKAISVCTVPRAPYFSVTGTIKKKKKNVDHKCQSQLLLHKCNWCELYGKYNKPINRQTRVTRFSLCLFKYQRRALQSPRSIERTIKEKTYSTQWDI